MRRIVSFGLTVGLGLALAAPGYSQEKLVLTLDDCLNLALSHNPFVLATREKEAAAEAQVREAASRFFPSVSGVGTDILDKKVFTLEFPSFVPGRAAAEGQVRFHQDLSIHPELLHAHLRRRAPDLRLQAGRTTTSRPPGRPSGSPSRRRSSTSRRPSTAISWPPRLLRGRRRGRGAGRKALRRTSRISMTPGWPPSSTS